MLYRRAGSENANRPLRYKLNSKEVKNHDEKNSLLPQSYYVNKEGSPMNSFTRETLF